MTHPNLRISVNLLGYIYYFFLIRKIVNYKAKKLKNIVLF